MEAEPIVVRGQNPSWNGGSIREANQGQPEVEIVSQGSVVAESALTKHRRGMKTTLPMQPLRVLRQGSWFSTLGERVFPMQAREGQWGRAVEMLLSWEMQAIHCHANCAAFMAWVVESAHLPLNYFQCLQLSDLRNEQQNVLGIRNTNFFVNQVTMFCLPRLWSTLS